MLLYVFGWVGVLLLLALGVSEVVGIIREAREERARRRAVRRILGRW